MPTDVHSQPDEALLAELARTVVQDVAPRELPLFPAASAAYFRDPGAVTRRRAADDTLGFGVELGVLLTPVVLSVLREVLTLLWSDVSGAARDAGRDAIKERVKRLFKDKEGAAVADAQPLTDAQRARVRARALEAAAALLPAAQAALVADAIEARLA